MARKWAVFLSALESFLTPFLLAPPSQSPSKRRWLRLLSLLLLGIFLAIAVPAIAQVPPAPTTPAISEIEQQVESAQQDYAAGRYLNTIQTLQPIVQTLRRQGDQSRLATTLTNLGLAQLALGRPEDALDSWQQAAILYQTLNNAMGKARSLIFQAQAWQELGAYTRTCETLLDTVKGLKILETPAQTCNDLTVRELLAQVGNSLTHLSAISAPGNRNEITSTNDLKKIWISGLFRLGDALRNIGKLDESEWILQSLSIWTSQNPSLVEDLSPQTIPSIYLSLGNTQRALATLKRDRQDITTKQGILPWKCQNSVVLSDPATEADTLREIFRVYDGAQQSYFHVSQEINETTPVLHLIRTQAHVNSLGLLIDYKLVEAYTRLANIERRSSSSSDLNTVREQFGDRTLGLRLAADYGRTATTVEQTLPNLLTELRQLPDSRTKVYTQIKLAKQLSCLQQKGIASTLATSDQIQILLESAHEVAHKLGDRWAESYALGSLGGFYELTNQLEASYRKTEEALLLVQSFESPAIAYQWEWQKGRLLKARGEKIAALKTFEKASKDLKSVRDGLLNVGTDVQFSFRDNVEPLYREYIDILLSDLSMLSPEEREKRLRNAIDVFGALQLAEFTDFFQCNPQLISPNDTGSQEAYNQIAFIYPILLKSRLIVIYKLIGQDGQYIPLKYHEVSFQLDPLQDNSDTGVTGEFGKTIETTIVDLRNDLTQPGRIEPVKRLSQKLYKWIFQPIQAAIDKEQIEVKTLIFVPDGYLRNIPMAVLFDGDRYLIEKGYAIAISPRLQLFTPKSDSNLNILVGGVGYQQYFQGGVGYVLKLLGLSYDQEFQNWVLSEPSSNTINPNITKFNEIDKFDDEVQSIQKAYNLSDSALLRNKAFTIVNLQQKLQTGNFSAIHLITHGEFSSDPNKTFIVAAGEIIKGIDLANLIQNTNNSEELVKAELLVLSACSTAKGDNRAVLGLAGTAIRAGTRSAVSTLWKAENIPGQQFMARFYEGMRTTTKAQALRDAQVFLIEEKGYNDPSFWANYILLGNWL